jgi:hypothetical protein
MSKNPSINLQLQDLLASESMIPPMSYSKKIFKKITIPSKTKRPKAEISLKRPNILRPTAFMTIS